MRCLIPSIVSVAVLLAGCSVSQDAEGTAESIVAVDLEFAGHWVPYPAEPRVPLLYADYARYEALLAGEYELSDVLDTEPFFGPRFQGKRADLHRSWAKGMTSYCIPCLDEETMIIEQRLGGTNLVVAFLISGHRNTRTNFENLDYSRPRFFPSEFRILRAWTGCVGGFPIEIPLVARYPDQPSFGLGGWGGLSQDTQTIQFVSDFEEEVRDGVVTGTYERKHVRVQLTGHLSSRSEVWSSDQSLFFSDTFRYLNEEFDELGQLTRRTKTDTKNASFSGPTLLDWSQVPMPSEISPFQ